MKLLEKLSKQKYSIDLLKCVLVKDGQAVATDLEQFIYAPTTLADGLYYGVGFASDTPVPCKDYDIEQYPVQTQPLDTSGCSYFVVNAEKFEWLSRAMSKEPSRYYLNGVFFKTSGKAAMYATDGHRAHKVSAECTAFILDAKEDGYNEGFIVPRETVNYINMAAKECKAKEFYIYLNPNRAIIVVGKYKISTKYVDGTYPDMERVIVKPNMDTPAPYDTKTMDDVIKRADFLNKVHGRKHSYVAFEKDGRVSVEAGDDTKETREVGFPAWGDGFGRVGFTSGYLKDVRKGSNVTAHSVWAGMGYTPMRFDEGDTTLVIMPLDLAKGNKHMTKIFKITAVSGSELVAYVEADDLAQAHIKAKELDGAEYAEIDNGYFEIKTVEEQIKKPICAVFVGDENISALPVATFDDPDLFSKCLPILEYHARKQGYTTVVGLRG